MESNETTVKVNKFGSKFGPDGSGMLESKAAEGTNSETNGLNVKVSSFNMDETSFMRTDEHRTSMINTTRGEFRVHKNKFRNKVKYEQSNLHG
jgi:hypothetical protein